MDKWDDKPEITVLMATYNGIPYIVKQIGSIINQSYGCWKMMIRDDGSSDGSVGIIERSALRDSRISFLKGTGGALGARGNFSFLAERAVSLPSNYFVFSDQDDVWAVEKISDQLDEMRRLERQNPGKPVLVHSDLELVDASLKPMAPSFMQYQGIGHEVLDPLKVLLVQNFVTGCTIMINRKLLDVALPIPKEALMHDWWLALCAAVLGHIGYISKPLVKYRQHDNNEVGAKYIGDFLNPLSGQWKQRWSEGRGNLFLSMKQAQALADHIRLHNPEHPHLALVESYASLQEMSPLKRIRTLHNLGVHAQSKSRHALLLSRLLLTPAIQHG